ncbi:MAG TPA: CPBP family glutamic-type intramembrane protease [Terracidiphilus sp.]|nr:CPBP family glutamic-type intramembrane protease [Terracidiphilus sp.]
MAERAQVSEGKIERADAGGRRRVWLELAVGYGLIVATIWTPRPQQAWLWWAALAWIVASSWWSFPGWAAMGFRRGGFVASLWVVGVACVLSACAVIVAIRLHTLRIPHSAMGWVLAWGGYIVWSFVQQYLLQGYFLFRFLRLITRRELAALAAAGIFAAAHLPNPLLTTVTLIWGVVACLVFLRCRNVYTLMLTHAILGVSLAITVPGPVMHNMRVGIGYLQYRAGHSRHFR